MAAKVGDRITIVGTISSVWPDSINIKIDGDNSRGSLHVINSDRMTASGITLTTPPRAVQVGDTYTKKGVCGTWTILAVLGDKCWYHYVSANKSHKSDSVCACSVFKASDMFLENP